MEMVILGVWIAISAVLFLRMEYKLRTMSNNFNELSVKLDGIHVMLNAIAKDVKAIAEDRKQNAEAPRTSI